MLMSPRLEIARSAASRPLAMRLPSRRCRGGKDRAIDLRPVQGAINADGLGNTLSGLAGTVPNTVGSTSVAVVDITGIALRAIGLFGGVFLIVLAFSPKVAALQGRRSPARSSGAYIFVLLILLFSHGLEADHRGRCHLRPGLCHLHRLLGRRGGTEQAVFCESLPLWFTTISATARPPAVPRRSCSCCCCALAAAGAACAFRAGGCRWLGQLAGLIREAEPWARWESMSIARLVLVADAAMEAVRLQVGPADRPRRSR